MEKISDYTGTLLGHVAAVYRPGERDLAFEFVEALGCAAANASLDLFDSEPRLQQVADITSALLQGLAPCRSMRGVKDVRVKGAIGVVEMERIDDLDGLRAHFVDEGVFVRPFGKIVYLTPAFTIASDEIKTLTGAVVKVVKELCQ